MSMYFGQLTERMEHFREEVLTASPCVCAERALLTTESYKAHQDMPVVLKRAYMMKNILENINTKKIYKKK